MDSNDIKVLRAIFDILDDQIGDTDPFMGDFITDEQIKDEHPVFWACREVKRIADKYDKSK